MKTNRLAIMGLFVALMCVSAWMRIPIPTPLGITYLTFQTAVAILAALLLAPHEAFFAMAAYVILGLVGLPVFANPGFAGLGYLASPTFGYLLGFVLGAPLGSLYLNRRLPEELGDISAHGFLKGLELTGPNAAAKRYGFTQCLLASLIVIMAVYVCGVTYIWAYARWIVGAPEPYRSLITTTSAFLWIKDSILGVVIASIAPRLRAIVDH
ncbi:MAG: biotin transporter BioY [Actinomycetia bacterium]|nr:biotin transporter BioY [Actinomycetes bacterium]